MSEDRRKNARTQGRFSDGDKEYSSRRPDKQNSKMPSGDKNKGEKRKAPIVGSRVQNEIDIQYEDDSNYSFKDFERVRKPQELRFSDPELILSETENGNSRLIYDPDFMQLAEANEYFEVLKNSTAWYDKNIVIRGVEYPQPRLVAWYGPHPYTYAGATLEAREMPQTIREIKERAEKKLRHYGINVELNSVLLNLYRNGKDSVAWHSDDELSLGICPTIVSVSLGEVRKFEMRPKVHVHVKDLDAGDVLYVNLTHGSLIVMDGCMQKDWQHRVPKEYHDKGPRINLTFRTIYSIDQLPPEIPNVSNMKSVKSPSTKIVHQQDPKFDAESFPPLGMEVSDKKTKLLPKENSNKEYQQSAIQRNPPKVFSAGSDKKTKFLPKENVANEYQKSTIQRKSSKEFSVSGDKKTKYFPKGNKDSCQQSVIQGKSHRKEKWDDEMLQSGEDSEEAPTIQNILNEKTSCDPIINSPELQINQIDFNSNVKESANFDNMQFPSSDSIKSEYQLDSSETYQSHNDESTGIYLLDSKDLGQSESKPIDFNSNVEESAKLCNKQFLNSNFIQSECQLDSSEIHQSHGYEPTGSHLLESKDPNPSESKPHEIKKEFIEIEANVADSGKKYTLNADAPDFIPQNKFEKYSLSELADYCCHARLKDEELSNFQEAICNSLEKDASILVGRDLFELDTYYHLMDVGSLNDEHLKIILGRISSMVKNAFFKKNDPRYRYNNRSFDENNYHKRKQSFGRSRRY